jgi:hypothetical protein
MQCRGYCRTIKANGGVEVQLYAFWNTLQSLKLHWRGQARWAPEHCWTRWGREKSLSLPGIEPGFLWRPDRSLVTILTELSWLTFYCWNCKIKATVGWASACGERNKEWLQRFGEEISRKSDYDPLRVARYRITKKNTIIETRDFVLNGLRY